MKNIFILTILILCTGSNFYAQTHKIEVNIPNLKNQEVIIGHHFNSQLIPDDTITLNNKGHGVFKGEEMYPGGMYFLFLPNKNLFDFILDKDQEFSISADTTDFRNTVIFKGSEENSLFIDVQRNMEQIAKEVKLLNDDKTKFKGNNEKLNEINTQIIKINKKRTDLYEKVISDNSEMFFAKFLKATRRVEVPKTITDKKQQYFYFRKHYFDPFDVSDPRLLRTPIYESTIDMYLDKVLMQHHDTLILEVDMLIEKSRTNDELFRFMLVHLFKKYGSSQLMTSENVYVHIAEKYYIKEAKWSDPKFINDLKGRINKKKKCLIGKNASDIDFRIIPIDTVKINTLIEQNKKLKEEGLQVEKSSADSTVKINLKVELLKDYFFEYKEIGSLYTTDAEYTIVWFWTTDCSHCRKDTPKFYDLYNEKKMYEKNVEVIAMFMQKDIADWDKFTKVNSDWLAFLKEHNLEKWTHTWNPFDLFRRNFDISSSPVLYLLDKNKKIIAKKIGYEQAFEVIESELKKKKISIIVIHNDHHKYPWGHSNPYNDFSTRFKSLFETRVQKIAVDAGFTCPNRDGKKLKGGCTYCNNDTFNPFYCDPKKSIKDQLIEGIAFFSEKYKSQKYLAYFQAYSNTYADLITLKDYYSEALSVSGVIGLVIATRPDCVDEAILDYLQVLAEKYYIVLEFGIETCNDDTLKNINRGHNYDDTKKALDMSKNRGLHVGIHYIIGLPGDSREENMKHVSLISDLPFKTLKLHQLQIIKGTKMAKQYAEDPQMFNLFDSNEYIDFIVQFVERLNPDIIIERFISESPTDLLIAPKWGGLKNFEIVSKINKRFKELNTYQGKYFKLQKN